LISGDGWGRFNIWEHSATVRTLYERRCLREADELTAHKQAAGLLRQHVEAGDSLLDVGCGSGYFFHSLRELPIEYYGIDGAPSLVAIGRRTMPTFGLLADRLMDMRIEDLSADVDHVVCINVLSNIDNYHRPLERMLLAARKTVILRESIGETSGYSYVEDRFLDPGVSLKVHVNTYGRSELAAFIQSYGFDVTFHVDAYTGGEPQDVIGYPHWWTFVEAVRQSAPQALGHDDVAKWGSQ